MMKNNNQNKYCNCQNFSNDNLINIEKNYFFCEKCGSILIKISNNNFYYTMKSKQKINRTEFNPIEIIRSMKKKTESDYPYLSNEYNMNEKEKNNKESFLTSINLYLKYRKIIILTLQKMMKMFDFTDLIFYQCLFYIDNYLSHNMSEDISEKTVLYYLVGYFLISSKFRETDIYEPSLDSFCGIKNKTYLTVEKISLYEAICLKSIKYNIFSYSAYDWISELINIGIVFNCEINQNNSIILIRGHRHTILNTISKYIQKILLNIALKNIFIKYTPMYIAFSLIQIAREKYLDKNYINPKLYNNLLNLYGINFNDYKNCYIELKSEIEDKKFDKKDTIKLEELEKKIDDNTINEIEKPKKGSTDDNLKLNNNYKIDKKVVVENKMKSSNAILYLRDNLIKIDEEQRKNENNEINNIINNYNDKNNNIDNISQINLIKDEAKNNINDLNQNKIRKSQDLKPLKIKNKSKLFINCNSNIFKSNDDLPKINQILDPCLNDILDNKDKIDNNSSSKEVEAVTIKFLKTNHKTLNPIKKTNSIDSNNKRYFQSIFRNNNLNNNLNNNNEFKHKEEFDSMRKTIFGDIVNNHKKVKSTKSISILSGPKNKMQSSNVIINIQSTHNLIKEDVNDEENKNNNNEINIKGKCKSKEKIKNIFDGKEKKIYLATRRNQSTNKN